jgi:hypothetical protein
MAVLGEAPEDLSLTLIFVDRGRNFLAATRVAAEVPACSAR